MQVLDGARFQLPRTKAAFPSRLLQVENVPDCLYGIGDLSVLSNEHMLAVSGSRKATPYGLYCSHHFTHVAANRGFTIVTGGARGVDANALCAALEANQKCVVVLGSGCDEVYPPEHFGLFQRVLDNGGVIISEHDYDFTPMPYAFRARNRIIAGLSQAMFVPECAMCSGTYSAVDYTLSSGKPVFAVPGAITSETSCGCNDLIVRHGATPIIDVDTFEIALNSLL